MASDPETVTTNRQTASPEQDSASVLRDFNNLIKRLQSAERIVESNKSARSAGVIRMTDPGASDRFKGDNLALLRLEKERKSFEEQYGIELKTEEHIGRVVQLPDGSYVVLEKPKVYQNGKLIQTEQWRAATKEEITRQTRL